MASRSYLDGPYRTSGEFPYAAVLSHLLYAGLGVALVLYLIL